MPASADIASQAPLFNYTLASADMRYIEVGERLIYLRTDPDRGPVIRGEIDGCGAACHVDLSQIFLEFTLSCEGCRQEEVVEDALIYFGERLGNLLAARIYPDREVLPEIERLTGMFDIVFASMNLPYSLDRETGSIHYRFHKCPFCDNPQFSGFMRSIEMARLGFISLCESILKNLAPDWVLAKPTRSDLGNPLLEVLLVQP
jgi:hypothetical protein